MDTRFERGARLNAEAAGVGPALGIYLHVPYCTVRCSYCDFYLVPGRERARADFAPAMRAEISAAPPTVRRRRVDTIHFGGGTPSLLPPHDLASILAAVRGVFPTEPEAEVGLEANPEDLDAERLAALAGLGVTRLTVGVQSLDDRLLRVMLRPHTAAQALAAIAVARRTPLRSLGADLILGLPGQDQSRTLQDLERLVALGVDHLSLYLLELHPRTRLGREAALGRVRPMGDDEAAGLYEQAADRLQARGFEHYEISNFARPGHRSRHNLKYWTDQDYLGFGPSAHSYIGGRRWMNRPDLADYLKTGGLGHAVDDPQPVSVRGVEALCAGLRLLEGVNLASLRARYGAAIPEPDEARIGELRAHGLVRIEGERLTLTRRGRLISNEVFVRLMGEDAETSRGRETGGAGTVQPRLS